MTEQPIIFHVLEESGAIFLDPHVIGFEGDDFDFMGEVGKIYNMLSTGTIQVNGKMGGKNNYTHFEHIGIKVGKSKSIQYIEMPYERDFLNFPKATLNKKRITQKPIDFATGLKSKDGKAVMGYACLNNDCLYVDAGSCIIKVKHHPATDELPVRCLNLLIRIKELGILSDGIFPHGVIGQTADGDGKGKIGRGKQGEGVIEGVYTDYEVSGLFADDFKFNRFGIQPMTKPRYGVGVKLQSIS